MYCIYDFGTCLNCVFSTLETRQRQNRRMHMQWGNYSYTERVGSRLCIQCHCTIVHLMWWLRFEFLFHNRFSITNFDSLLAFSFHFVAAEPQIVNIYLSLLSIYSSISFGRIKVKFDVIMVVNRFFLHLFCIFFFVYFVVSLAFCNLSIGNGNLKSIEHINKLVFGFISTFSVFSSQIENKNEEKTLHDLLYRSKK